MSPSQCHGWCIYNRAKQRKTKSLQLYEYFYEHFDINSNRTFFFLLLLQFELVQMLTKGFFESKFFWPTLWNAPVNGEEVICDRRPHKSLRFKKIVRFQRLASTCLTCELPEASGHRQVSVRGPCLLHRKFTLRSMLTQGHAENRRAYGRALA